MPAKGGKSVPAEKRPFPQNRDLAARAGRKGGSASQSGQGAHYTTRIGSIESRLHERKRDLRDGVRLVRA